MKKLLVVFLILLFVSIPAYANSLVANGEDEYTAYQTTEYIIHEDGTVCRGYDKDGDGNLECRHSYNVTDSNAKEQQNEEKDDSWSIIVSGILASILITALGYLLFPMCVFAYCKIRNTWLIQKTAKTITIANGAIVWLIFQVIAINNGESGSGAAVFLWSAIAYYILKTVTI